MCVGTWKEPMLIITLLFTTLRFLVVLWDVAFFGAHDPKARSRLEWEDEMGIFLKGISSIKSFDVTLRTTGLRLLITILVPSSVNLPIVLPTGTIFFFSMDKFLLPSSCSNLIYFCVICAGLLNYWKTLSMPSILSSSISLSFPSISWSSSISSP